jgi:hypothetical protein
MSDADEMLCERCEFWTPHDKLPKPLQAAPSLGRCGSIDVMLNAKGMTGYGVLVRTEYTTAKFGCRFWRRQPSDTDGGSRG